MNNDLLKFIETLSKKDSKTLSQKTLKMAEEVGELAKVVLPYESAFATTHRFVNKEKILEEIADTLLVDLSIAYSLDFNYSDIEDMVKKKALKWAELQNKEAKANYPVPYELHVTVANANPEYFKSTCDSLGIKPLLIDLQSNSGDNLLYDLMTSQIHVGNNSSAYSELNSIAHQLSLYGYDIIRKKIETVPWHPAAPSIKDIDPKMPPNCYFESHIGVIIKESDLNLLHAFMRHLPKAHLSKNIFKRDHECIKIMITYRDFKHTYEEFKTTIDEYTEKLTAAGFSYDDPIIEFSLFDSKVSHDAEWLRKP